MVSASVLAQQNVAPVVSGKSWGGQGNSANQQPKPANAAPSKAGVAQRPTRSTAQWLTRLRQASSGAAYTGTYVVWSAPGTLASSRIWHASKGDVRVERVDALSGQLRSTYRVTDRRGSNVETFLPAERVLRIESSQTPTGGGGFPNLPDASQGASPANYYDAQQQGQERVAGFMADVVQFVPRDSLRYGYRVWSEQRTGLVIKQQTLDEHERVLEQAAFSSLTFDAPFNVTTLLRGMYRTRGWRVEHVVREPTTAVAEGWRIGEPTVQPAPGFALQHCYRQSIAVRAADPQAENAPESDPAPSGNNNNSGGGVNQNQVTALRWFQCVFSDGLAAVSVFIEPYDAARREGYHEGQAADAGATHLLARHVGATGWVTVVGEVPAQTLKRFAQGVARQRQR
jgi:sigma-E factor negative regulatory protein RseB